MTSSDVLDTCFNLQLVQAADLLIADVDGLLAALKTRALEHKDTLTVGRSHGVHAEPTTFGLKLAYAYAEFVRARAGLGAAREEVATCAISGAVGTFAHVDPRVEVYVAKKLGLRPSRSRRKWSRATATPPISPRSPWWRARSSGSQPRSGICSGPKLLEAEEYLLQGAEGLLGHAA